MDGARWTRHGLTITAALVVVTTVSCGDSLTPTSGDAAGAREVAGAADRIVSAAAVELCGVIPATVVLTENTRLACDVVCTNSTGPCIQFGRDNVTLFLNSFTMTGPASPPNNCAPNPGPATPYDGVASAGFDRVAIRGPGMIQKFRRHGIFLFESAGARVERVTSHYNCFSGILLNASHGNDIVENVSVRNSSASGPAPCGGNCLVSSNDNRIWRNHFYGNGSVAPGAPGGANDFGVGLVGTSSGNVVEDNAVGGNINGLLVFPTATGNLIRRNLFAGNPPVQVSATAGSPVGVDIRNTSPAGANTFRDNHCITSEGAITPDPCPNFPRSRGHY